MKTIAWIAVVALAAGGLAAGLRRPMPEAPRGAERARPVPAAPAPAAAPVDPVRRTADRLKVRSEDVDAFVAASRNVVRDLRRLQVQRQSEWELEVDQQIRLEWEERFDADREEVLERLDPFLGAEARREFREQVDTWAATLWAREQGVYR